MKKKNHCVNIYINCNCNKRKYAHDGMPCIKFIRAIEHEKNHRSPFNGFLNPTKKKIYITICT